MLTISAIFSCNMTLSCQLLYKWSVMILQTICTFTVSCHSLNLNYIKCTLPVWYITNQSVISAVICNLTSSFGNSYISLTLFYSNFYASRKYTSINMRCNYTCTQYCRSVGPNPNNPSVLWNSMIHPFLQMPIYGAVWYQGEANAGILYTWNKYIQLHIRLMCSLYGCIDENNVQ